MSERSLPMPAVVQTRLWQEAGVRRSMDVAKASLGMLQVRDQSRWAIVMNMVRGAIAVCHVTVRKTSGW